MESFELTEENILVADLVQFNRISEDNVLTYKRLEDWERFRKVVYFKGRYFDLETEEEYYFADIREDGIVYGPIFVNTSYVTKTWRVKKVTYNDVIEAALLVDRKLHVDELIKKRKVLLMPREQIL